MWRGCWPSWPSAASPTWRWRPHPTGSTSAGSTGCTLTAAGFLNLTQDHLDYHGTMGAYRAAKLRLFETLLPRGATAVLNADSDAFPAFAATATLSGHPLMSVGETGAGAEAGVAHDYCRTDSGWRSSRKAATYDIKLPLAGAFQASNALVAAGLCIAAGEEIEAVLAALEHIEGAPGPAAAGRRRTARRRGLCRLRPHPRRTGDRAQGAAAARRRPADRGVRRRRRPRSRQAADDGRGRRAAGRRGHRHRRQSPLRTARRHPRRHHRLRARRAGGRRPRQGHRRRRPTCWARATSW